MSIFLEVFKFLGYIKLLKELRGNFGQVSLVFLVIFFGIEEMFIVVIKFVSVCDSWQL